jgi:hypothetical protein
MNLWYNIINIRGLLIMSIGDKFTIIKHPKSGKEKIMKKQSITIIAIMVLGLAGPSEAVIVELDLFTLGMPTNFNDNSPSWQTNFDLGVTFTQISHVYINWSGEITAGLSTYMGSGASVPFNENVSAILGTSPNWRHTEVHGGQITYPVPELFDISSEFVSGSMPWSELFDGQGTIGIRREGILTSPEIIILQRGSITLNSATLVVDGIITPEPATILFLGIGVISLCVKKRIR